MFEKHHPAVIGNERQANILQGETPLPY